MFFQSLINADFFTCGIDLNILIKKLKYWIIFLFWAAGFLFILFYFVKNKDFQPGSLLKIQTEDLFNSCHELIWKEINSERYT